MLQSFVEIVFKNVSGHFLLSQMPSHTKMQIELQITASQALKPYARVKPGYPDPEALSISSLTRQPPSKLPRKKLSEMPRYIGSMFMC
jgi:hypothetical protein